MSDTAAPPAVAARQRTLAATCKAAGIGLHSGREVSVELGPAESGSGISFHRLDLAGTPVIRSGIERVSGVEWETVLGEGEVSVRTVEHLLAATSAMGVDNLEVRLDGPEPPALDGSSIRWCELIQEVGTIEQDAEPDTLVVEEPLTLMEGASRYTVTPYAGYRVSASIDFEHPCIGRQFASTEVEPEEFCQHVAAARTFGLQSWAEELRARGLAHGAGPQNTIVLTEDGLADGTQLRFPDEFVRHKLIDLIGDLALLGQRLRAHVIADRPSHRGNAALARRLSRLSSGGGSRIPVLDVRDILKHIPHRYPFLLVDRILEFEAGRRIVGLKNVTMNEPFFAGHFPDHPIMPGVLIVEAMAQVGGLLLMNAFENPQDKVVYFMSLDDVKFRRPVTPGDQLLFEVEMLKFRGKVCKMHGVGRVDGQVVAEATMMARVIDR